MFNFLLKKNIKNIEYSDSYIPNCQINRDIKKKSVKLTPKVLKNSDIIILATDHDYFDYKMIKKYSKFIIDCRGKYTLNEKIVRG